jgi:hypothetical protein
MVAFLYIMTLLQAEISHRYNFGGVLLPALASKGPAATVPTQPSWPLATAPTQPGGPAPPGAS